MAARHAGLPAAVGRGLGIALFDHFVGAREQRWWNDDAQRLSSFEVDHKVEPCWLLNGQIGTVEHFFDSIGQFRMSFDNCLSGVILPLALEERRLSCENVGVAPKPNGARRSPSEDDPGRQYQGRVEVLGCVKD